MPDNLTPDPTAEHERLLLACVLQNADTARELLPIDAAAKRYNCAAGMVARYAIEHGMKGALARLRRELPPDQWPSAAAEETETAERG